MKKTKVLYVSQEITPFLPESTISNISRYLPQGVQESGMEIRTFMPRYGTINERRNQLHEVIRLSGMNIIIEDYDHPLIIKVASIQSARMQVYFIENEDFFHRNHVLFDDEGKHFKDNDSRAIFFARGVLETVNKLQWRPDIIHCQGWFTFAVPILLKTMYSYNTLFTDSKIIYSLYKDGFSGSLSDKLKQKFKDEDIKDKYLKILDKTDYCSISKFAIDNSDAIVNAEEGVDSELSMYTEKSGKPFLKEPPNQENYVETYMDFYNKIINK